VQKLYESIHSDLAGQIVQRIGSNSPQFFERLVVNLMVAMGYGGSRADTGKSIDGTWDEGIDGIKKEDTQPNRVRSCILLLVTSYDSSPGSWLAL
jgi:restriction system protein